MAGRGRTAGTGSGRGIRGSWFWLAASFAATLMFTASERARAEVADVLLDDPVVVAMTVIFWGVAGHILAVLLGAAAKQRPPEWVFVASDWTVATLGAGVLLALAAAGDPEAVRPPRRLLVGLMTVGALSFAWWLVIDLGRIVLWRISGRAAPPFLSVGTLAFLGGLGGLAAVLRQHVVEGPQREPMEAGLAYLGIALVAGALLTMALEVPRALLPRLLAARRAADDPARARPMQTIGAMGRDAAPGGLAGALRTMARGGTPPPSSGVGHVPQARATHGAGAPAPTVVRRP